MKRRTLLVGVAGSLSVLAGCIGETPSSSQTTEPSATSPSRTPPNVAATTSTNDIETTTTVNDLTTSTNQATTTPETSTVDPIETTTSDPEAVTPTRISDPSATDTGAEMRPGTATRCSRGVTIETEPFDAAKHATATLDDGARAIVAEAVANGTATRSTYGERPLRGGVFVEYEGTFYRIGHAVESIEVSAYRTNVEWKRGQEAPANASVVEFSALPENDRTALRYAIYGGEKGTTDPSSDKRGQLPANSLSGYDYPAPYPGGDGSRLVGGGLTWVSWDEHVFRVELGAATTTERETHEYTVKNVAGNATEFEKVIASRYLIRLDDLPDEEHEIVRRAVDDRYRACGMVEKTIPVLDERLRDEKRLPDGYNSWYVRFEGGAYLLRVLRWES